MDAAGLSSLAEPNGARSVRGPQCMVGRILQWVKHKEAEGVFEALQRVLDDPAVEASTLAQYLRENDYEVAAYTIRRHRRRGTGEGCRCPR